MSDSHYDVIIVGYGPVSQLLALALGRQGRSVAVIERWEQRYSLPRAVAIDHEIYRVLAANGLSAKLPSFLHPGKPYQWFNADWRELLSLDWTAEAVSGGPGVYFVHQPTLEEALDDAIRAQPTIELLLGTEALSIEQDGEAATVVARNNRSGEERVLSSLYLVGCDGAGSTVREAVGGGQEDRGFEADWLVIDVLLKGGVTVEQLGIPAFGQYCNPAQPTTIVPGGVSGDQLYRRWEFMRLPGTTVEELEQESRVWELLSRWAGPDDVELVRHKVYNFRSLLAERWRNRRLLIAGDAAHVMPPFLGQGMCSGMRDAWNLAWKLGLILDGKAGDRLLDSYQQERSPHVSQLIDMSIYLGKIICIPDPAAAAERDLTFFNGTPPAFPPFPDLEQGILLRLPDGSIQPGAGALAPHVQARYRDRQGRLDDLVEAGTKLVIADHVSQVEISPQSRRILDRIGGEILWLSASAPDHLTDLDGRLGRFMKDHGWVAMIVRPDFYIYGGSDSSEGVSRLLETFAHDLALTGISASDGEAFPPRLSCEGTANAVR